MAKVEEELQGVKDQIKARLGKRRKKGRRRRHMEDDAFVEEAGSSEEVGVWGGSGRFTGGRVGVGERGGGSSCVVLSEENRERCMRTFAEPSDGQVSSLTFGSEFRWSSHMCCSQT